MNPAEVTFKNSNSLQNHVIQHELRGFQFFRCSFDLMRFHLEQVKTQLFHYYQELKFKRELITAQIIKAHFIGETDSHKTLQNLIDYNRRKIETTLSCGTIRNFGVTEGYIKCFLHNVRKTSDIYLKQLNYKFICDFEDYLHTYWPKGHPKAMGHHTVMKHLQRFRKIVTLAFHIEWLDKDPFIRWLTHLGKTRT